MGRANAEGRCRGQMQRVDVKGSAKGRCKRQTQHTDAQSGRLSMALCIDAFSVLMSLAGILMSAA